MFCIGLIWTLWLAVGAVVAAALGNADFVDDGAAALAGLAVPPIDIKMTLRIALRAVWLEIPANAGAFVLDAAMQRILNRLMQTFDVLICQLTGADCRVNAGLKQCLISVDVADAGDKALVEQKRLDHALAPLQTLAKQGGGKGFAKRFRPQMSQQFLCIVGQIHSAKLAAVGKAQLPALIQLKAHMNPFIGAMPRIIGGDIQTARHFEMHHQHIGIEFNQNIFGAPPDGMHRLAGHTRGEFGWMRRMDGLLPVVPHRLYRVSNQRLAQPADDRLDFWQFRHIFSLFADLENGFILGDSFTMLGAIMQLRRIG